MDITIDIQSPSTPTLRQNNTTQSDTNQEEEEEPMQTDEEHNNQKENQGEFSQLFVLVGYDCVYQASRVWSYFNKTRLAPRSLYVDHTSLVLTKNTRWPPIIIQSCISLVKASRLGKCIKST